MELFEFGRCAMRPATRELWVDGQPVHVGSRAFDVLHALIERRHRVVGIDELLALVWPGRIVEESNLRVHIAALRKLLGPQSITTVPGQGYQFTAALRLAASTLPGPSQLFGRTTDLEKLRALMASHALVSVVGPGGVGKTSLARTLVQARAKTEAGAEMVLLDLSPLVDATQLAPAVASACRIVLGGGPTLPALAAQLRQRQLLLVLDNAEHVLADVAELVAALLADGSPLRVLVTSQAPLRLHAEQVYRLGSLALADALALFESRAHAADPHFSLDASNRADAADVCRQLDGIPLAIELAAARVSLLGVAGLRRRLDERLRLLTGGAPDRPLRQRTLAAALEWSHALLTPVQQVVFRRLGVFSGSFDLEAAQHVVADTEIDAWSVLDALGALVDHSLLTTESDSENRPRYRLLETMRQDALARLMGSGKGNDARNDAGNADGSDAGRAEERTVRSRHRDFYVELATRARTPLAGAEQGRWLARLDADRDNLYAAHRACDSAPADVGLRLVNSLMRFWLNRGLMEQGQRMALEAAERAGAPQHPALTAEALLHAGWLQAYRGLDAQAATILSRSVALGRSCGATALVAEALSRLGYVHIGLADRVTARACIEEACTLARQHATDLALQRLVIANLAELERLEGRPQIAQPLYEQSLRHARSGGDRLATMIALNNLAMCAVAAAQEHQLQQSRALLVESLAICDELGSRRGRLVVMEVCAAFAAQLQQWSQAARFNGAAEHHTDLMGRRRDVVDAAFLVPHLAQARQVLGDIGYAQMLAAGAELTYEQSVVEMREWLNGDGQAGRINSAAA